MEDMASFMSISGAGRVQDTAVEKIEKRTSCVVTTDDSREQWVRTVLEHFGHEVFPREAYFNQGPGAEAVDLVLVDPQCLTAQRLERLLKYLSTQSADVVMLREPETTVSQSIQAYPSMGFVFSRRELGRVLAAQNA